ncbi:MAG: VOC family protein [Chloroflexota bacterium]
MAQVFHHMAIACQDPLVVERYYSRYFGFERARVIPLGDGTQIVFLKNGPAYLELFQCKESRPAPRAGGDGPWYPEWRHIAFMVDDVDAKLAELGEAARVTLGPFSFDAFIPGWRTVWVEDPEGNIVEISQGFVDEAQPPALDA